MNLHTLKSKRTKTCTLTYKYTYLKEQTKKHAHLIAYKYTHLKKHVPFLRIQVMHFNSK